MKIKHVFSPNFDAAKRTNRSIKKIVIHYTGMQSERESLLKLCDSKHKVSSHFLISQQGKVFRLVQDNRTAWHAGKSCWRKTKNLNNCSIGIELVNKGHRFGYTNFKKKQLISLVKICKQLIKKYKIKKENIIGHSDIAPLRKIDPGEKFPWEYLAKKKIGVWHNFKSGYLKKFRKVKISQKSKEIFFRSINKIGYCYVSNKKAFLNKIVKAFQRHFRKQLVNGIIDKECLIIAENISKKF